MMRRARGVSHPRAGAGRSLILPDSRATLTLGARIGRSMPGDGLVAVRGDLGAGKTTLIQGICQGLGVGGAVTSPSFTLMHQYVGDGPVYHLDLYRIEGERELWDLALSEFLESGWPVLIEWADRAGTLLDGEERLDALMEWADGGRRISLTPWGPEWSRVVDELGGPE